MFHSIRTSLKVLIFTNKKEWFAHFILLKHHIVLGFTGARDICLQKLLCCNASVLTKLRIDERETTVQK
jgi:hypothetical protein